jgi:hypothetical protein
MNNSPLASPKVSPNGYKRVGNKFTIRQPWPFGHFSRGQDAIDRWLFLRCGLVILSPKNKEQPPSTGAMSNYDLVNEHLALG